MLFPETAENSFSEVFLKKYKKLWEFGKIKRKSV